MPYSVLMVGGDAKEQSAAAASLRPEFDLAPVRLGRHALERLEKAKPDLALVDAELDDMEGLTLLQAFRQSEAGRDMPAIVLARQKTEEYVVRAYELGVDDFLVKPVDPRELLVRVRAVLRRRYERAEHLGAPLALAGVELDPSQRLCLVKGKAVLLQPREFELLEILMRKAGRVLTRAYLLETVWGMSLHSQTRAVDVMVSRLRRSLGRLGARIQTVSKLGYVFRM
ncbi:MAG: response regulator transcription factor [Elusimicrobia bacterium]|nr:response regulator transcription factor [Elusimicrobiota bacterium]